jgi:hypothetical protein
VRLQPASINGQGSGNYRLDVADDEAGYIDSLDNLYFVGYTGTVDTLDQDQK